jgi:hypothetical protein
VQAYTVHFFDEFEHVRRSIRLYGQTDEQVIDEAAALRHRHVLEIWQGDRRVWRFEPALSQLQPPAP